MYLIFSKKLYHKMFRRATISYLLEKMIILFHRHPNFGIVKIHYKNKLLRIPHMPCLIYPKVFLPLWMYGGLFQDHTINKHFVSLGTNGAFTFQRVKYQVIILMRTKQTPSLRSIIWHIEPTLWSKACPQCLQFPNWKISFNHCIGAFQTPQNAILKTKLDEIVETKGLKVFWMWKQNELTCCNLWSMLGKNKRC
jgi:hypothetical protein